MSDENDENSVKSPKLRTVEQISAGGVAFRLAGEAAEIAVILAKPALRWQLPKGIIDAGETPEIAALREVREEAGIETELISKIKTIEYWYVGDNRGERVRFHKLVHFFLLKYTGGSVADHDCEVAEARWVKSNEVIRLLAFKGEKEVAGKAVALINNLG